MRCGGNGTKGVTPAVRLAQWWGQVVNQPVTRETIGLVKVLANVVGGMDAAENAIREHLSDRWRVRNRATLPNVIAAVQRRET